MEPTFTHLHLHTEQKQVALAITDHGNLYGAIHFYKAARRHGIKPIMGCEAYVTPGNHREKVLVNGRQANHLVLLAETNRGFENLMKLISRAHLDGYYYKPRIDRALLAEHSEGLIALSACLKGEVAEALMDGLDDKAAQLAGEYAEIMGPGRFYLEVQEHGLPEQAPVNAKMVELSRKLGLPLVATNDVHYLTPQHVLSHEMLLCLQTQAKWSETDRMKYGSDQFYLKSESEMRAMFPELPEAIANTWKIAERCNVTLELAGQKNPHFPNYQCPGGLSHKDYLTQIAVAGVRQLYGVADPAQPRDDRERVIVERMNYEISVIEKMGFLNYYLVVWDFIHAAKQMGVPVGPGRGSGAGSLVAYAMGITGIDPLRYGLIFERFLNPERVSPPDFDIDFCQARRGEVLDYVRRKYGADSVVQIITYGTLGAKTLIRDLGRALEFPLPDCDRLAKMVPEVAGTTLEKALNTSVDFKTACKTEPYAIEIMKYAPQLEDMPRQPGTHAAGVVIGDKPLLELVPLTRDKDGNIISQWEAGPLEDLGLLKMDFLGLKTLTVVREACDNVRQTCGIEINPDNLPLDDAETYKLLARGDTVGVFQVESEGMRDLLRQLQVNKIEELIAMIALYRPGPMGTIPAYIARKHGREAITYAHPLLEDVLKETYGFMVYQEQVQQAAFLLAGFNLGQGDILRRAMGKKQAEQMRQQRQAFVDGCLKQKTCNAAKAGEIFDQMAAFAEYGFNKSHSAAYSMVTFQTAYLKTHYPVEFMAALLSSEIGNTDKLPVLVAEAQKMGIPVLPPDINESGARFTPRQGKIRYGLAGVKGVGQGAVAALVKERETNGPFLGFVDFCERMDSGETNKKTLEALVKCGAFDFTKLMRGRLHEGIESAMSYAATRRKDRAAGQASLFEMLGADSAGAHMRDEDLPVMAPWPQNLMLSYEKELIGFYISGHPLLAYNWTLEKFNRCDATQFAKLPENSPTRIGGLVINAQRRFTKRATPQAMMSFQLETLAGTIAAVAFPKAFEKYGGLLTPDAAVMLCGTVRKDNGSSVNMLAVDEIHPLDMVPEKFALSATVHIPVGIWDEARMQALQELLRRYPGTTPVNLSLIFPDNLKVYIATGKAYAVRVAEAFAKECVKLGLNLYVEPRRDVCLEPPPAKRAWSRNRTD